MFTEIITIGIVTLLASVLTFYSGFGLGTVLLPVMSIFFPVHVSIVLTAIVHLLTNIFKLSLLTSYVHIPTLFRFGLPAILSSILGAYILSVISSYNIELIYTVLNYNFATTILNLLIGSLLISFATMELLPSKNIYLPIKYLPIGGMISGFFGGLSGMQGAFRSAFLLRVGLNNKRFVATNAAIATTIDMVRIIIYGIAFHTTIVSNNHLIVITAVFCAFAGSITSNKILHKINIKYISILVTIFLYSIGILLIIGLLN